MTTQAALDRFPITHVILFGAAGGVNPVREPGDVAIPENWAYHMEAA
jgi:adenosylhomocysteine nucleosidase